MARLRAIFSATLLAGFLAAVIVLIPQEAVAHTSLVAEPSIDLSSHTADEEAHCHGAVECFVTLYFEALPVRAPSDISSETPTSGPVKQYRGTSLSRDPPVPILFL